MSKQASRNVGIAFLAIALVEAIVFNFSSTGITLGVVFLALGIIFIARSRQALG